MTGRTQAQLEALQDIVTAQGEFNASIAALQQQLPTGTDVSAVTAALTAATTAVAAVVSAALAVVQPLAPDSVQLVQEPPP